LGFSEEKGEVGEWRFTFIFRRNFKNVPAEVGTSGSVAVSGVRSILFPLEDTLFQELREPAQKGSFAPGASKNRVDRHEAYESQGEHSKAEGNEDTSG
jgi:hypothetical protein